MVIFQKPSHDSFNPVHTIGAGALLLAQKVVQHMLTRRVSQTPVAAHMRTFRPHHMMSCASTCKASIQSSMLHCIVETCKCTHPATAHKHVVHVEPCSGICHHLQPGSAPRCRALTLHSRWHLGGSSAASGSFSSRCAAMSPCPLSSAVGRSCSPDLLWNCSLRGQSTVNNACTQGQLYDALARSLLI